jgi:hypothetical protein
MRISLLHRTYLETQLAKQGCILLFWCHHKMYDIQYYPYDNQGPKCLLWSSTASKPLHCCEWADCSPSAKTYIGSKNELNLILKYIIYYTALLYKLEDKWDSEGRFDIPVTKPCFVNLMSCILSSNDSMSFRYAKRCVVNTLDFKISQWITYPRSYRFELLEG